MDGVGEQLLPRPGLPAQQNRRIGPGGPLRLLLGRRDRGAGADDAREGVPGAPQVRELLLVIFHLRLEEVHLRRQLPELLHGLEDHPPVRPDDPVAVFQGDPVDDQGAAVDRLPLADLRHAGLRHDVHPGVLDHLRRMLPHGLGDRGPVEPGVLLADHRDDPVGVDDHHPLPGAGEHLLEGADQGPRGIELPRHLLHLGHVLEDGHGADQFPVPEDRGPVRDDGPGADRLGSSRLRLPRPQDVHQPRIRDDGEEALPEGLSLLHAEEARRGVVEDEDRPLPVDGDHAVGHRIEDPTQDRFAVSLASVPPQFALSPHFTTIRACAPRL